LYVRAVPFKIAKGIFGGANVGFFEEDACVFVGPVVGNFVFRASLEVFEDTF
jgi:hypothetical protein